MESRLLKWTQLDHKVLLNRFRIEDIYWPLICLVLGLWQNCSKKLHGTWMMIHSALIGRQPCMVMRDQVQSGTSKPSLAFRIACMPPEGETLLETPPLLHLSAAVRRKPGWLLQKFRLMAQSNELERMIVPKKLEIGKRCFFLNHPYHDRCHERPLYRKLKCH